MECAGGGDKAVKTSKTVVAEVRRALVAALVSVFC
jgi:hypothetical protein